MKSKSKTVRYDNVTELTKAAKELGKDHRGNHELLRNIVINALGSDEEKGIIVASMERYFSKNPVNWAEELENLSQIFSPNGEVFSGHGGLIANADHTVSIDVQPSNSVQHFAKSRFRLAARQWRSPVIDPEQSEERDWR